MGGAGDVLKWPSLQWEAFAIQGFLFTLEEWEQAQPLFKATRWLPPQSPV